MGDTWGIQQQTAAARSSQEQPGAARNRQEQAGAARTDQEQPGAGAARSSQKKNPEKRAQESPKTPGRREAPKGHV